jgi:peptide deformylase
MSVREIITHPAPVLRRKARKVSNFGPELQTLIDDMVETMRAAPGVGLAAPQVNVPLRVIVVEYAEKDEGDDGDAEDVPPKLYTVVNPEIIRASDEMENGTEGCLSIPGFLGDVDRPINVTVKGNNRRGQQFRLNASGWLARIFQHEIDHLDGVLFIDRTEKVTKVDEQTAQVAPAD